LEKLNEYSDLLIEMAMAYSPKLLLALATYIIGWWLTKKIANSITGRMKKSKMDAALRKYFGTLILWLLRVALIISIMSIVGIVMTSFVAILGAMGLAFGLALSGTLQNFAGGAMILIFKPYVEGDYIAAQGYEGIVKGIEVFNTVLKTLDNKIVIIPNAKLANESLTNYTKEATRRVDFTFGIGYNDDIDHAKSVLFKVIGENKLVMNDPAPFVAVSELADSSVNLVVRVWAKTEDYWDVYFYMQETVKKEFDKEKISIPFPQRDIHMHQG